MVPCFHNIFPTPPAAAGPGGAKRGFFPETVPKSQARASPGSPRSHARVCIPQPCRNLPLLPSPSSPASLDSPPPQANPLPEGMPSLTSPTGHGAVGGFAAASPQTASKPDVRNGKLSLWGHGGPESAVRAAKRGRSTRTGPPATASVLLPRRELTSFALRAARALAMTRSYLTMRG